MGLTPEDGGSSSPDGLPLIRASELVQYSFCHRAWWLGTVKGLTSQSQVALERGTRHHKHHGGQVYTAKRWQQLGLILLAGGIFLLVFTLFWLWV
jgi:hypothetical protein